MAREFAQTLDPVRAVNEAMGNQIAAMLSGNKGNMVEFKTKIGA